MPTEFMEADDAEFIEVDEAALNPVDPTTKSNDYGRLWDTLAAAKDDQRNMQAMVIDVVKGGVVVDLGVRGFIPKSQLATRNLSNLERYIGQTVDVKVVDVDRESGRVVLSERRAADEQRAAQRAATLSTLEKGQVLRGTVRRITDFGAFVDIGGIDGLLHVSDIAWESVKHTSDVLKVGDNVDVLVLKIERDGERISLGMKQLEDDPWSVARKELREGQVIEGEVTRVESFGAFVKVMKGVEGLIPTKELAERRTDNPEHVVQVGQTVTAKIIEFHTRDRRMTLSIREALRDGERREMREYMTKQRSETATPTLGDLFGDVFSKLKKGDD